MGRKRERKPFNRNFKGKVSLYLAVATLALVAASSEARTYTVTLENGATYETRYPPREDPELGVTRIVTDVGNWIAVRTSEIADVESQEDTSGFGRRLDTTPRFLGWIEVDDPPLREDEAGDAARYVLPEPHSWRYSIERFQGPRSVAPGETGGGIPLEYFYSGGPESYLDTFFDPGLDLSFGGDGGDG